MSKTMSKTMTKLFAVLSATPGVTAWDLAAQLGLKKQRSKTPRLASGKFTSRKRHIGYDLVQRTLRRAEQLGDVVSVKSNDGKRLWFVAEAA